MALEIAHCVPALCLWCARGSLGNRVRNLCGLRGFAAVGIGLARIRLFKFRNLPASEQTGDPVRCEQEEPEHRRTEPDYRSGKEHDNGCDGTQGSCYQLRNSAKSVNLGSILHVGYEVIVSGMSVPSCPSSARGTFRLGGNVRAKTFRAKL